MPDRPESDPFFPPRVYRSAIALGSNLPSAWGTPAENIAEAVRRIGALGQVLATSALLRTAPVGYTDQPEFTNGALILATELDPGALMHALLAIEREMGRHRAAVPAKGPRVIDLDLLLYEDLVLHTQELTLPHPAMAERIFVLEPLAQIASAWVHPVTGKTMGEMLAKCASEP